MQQEIDLTPYIAPLFHRWYLIVAPLILLAGLGVGYGMLQQEQFSAIVLLAPTRLTTFVSFGTAIETASESSSSSRYGRNEFLAACAEIAVGPAIAERVVEGMGDTLAPKDRDPRILASRVEAKVLAGTDLVELTVRHADPALAEQIASHWALACIDQVNQVYGVLAAEPYDRITQEIADAKTSYDAAQAELEAATATDRHDALIRAISELQVSLDVMTQAHQASLASQMDELARTEILLELARELQSELQGGNGATAASSAVALLNLKNDTYAAMTLASSSTALPTYADREPTVDEDKSQAVVVVQTHANVSVSPMERQGIQVSATAPTLTREEMIEDLSGLVSILESRHSRIATQISKATQQIGRDTNLSSSRASIQERMRALKAELEENDSILREKTAQRDIAWEAYNALIQKETELALSIATASEELRVASPARVAPIAKGQIKSGAIGGIAGAVLGIILLYGIELWQGYRKRDSSASAPTA